MERRIYGLETKYGLLCTLAGRRQLSSDEVARYVFRRVVNWGRTTDVFLENGARLSLDDGLHPDYATPECDSLHELVSHDKAGERIIESLVGDAQNRLREEGINGIVRAIKNNEDSSGGPHHCDESYLIKRPSNVDRWIEQLIPFLVTRQILVGAGKILRLGSRATYVISPRAEHVWDVTAPSARRSTGMIDLGGEPYADANEYLRLQVLVGDSSMSEFSTYLRFGATSLVLRMLEEGGALPLSLALDNPIRAIREISHDLTCQREVRLDNGQEVSALQIQQEYMETARGFVARSGSTPIEKQALELWEHCVSALAQDPMSLGRECDWVIKYGLIDRFRQRHDVALTDPRTALVDLYYHDVSRRFGLYFALEDDGLVDRMLTDADIDLAITKPPQTTRARLRGEFIRRAKEQRLDHTADWTHMRLRNPASDTVTFGDPFEAENAALDALLPQR